MTTKPNISFENLEVAFASKSDLELRKMYLMFAVVDNNLVARLGMNMANIAFKLRLPIKGILKKTIFGHFCGGEDIEDCETSIKELVDYGIKAILDYSVEGSGTEKGYDFTRDEIIRTIERAAGSTYVPFSVFKVSGVGNERVMTKVQAGQKLSSKEENAYNLMKQRVEDICKTAYEKNVRLLVDAEESWFQDVVDELVYEAMEKYNKERAIVYNTYQMYRKDMLRNLKDAHHDAVAKGYYIGAKLVRGAYMEKEADRAEEREYPNPIHDAKEDTDNDFNEGLKFCINNKQRIFLVNGTHNELSNIILTELMALHGVKPDDERFYFAQLYGMSDHISYNLADAGYNVVKYVPYGPVESVMPYLYRRAMENTSVSDQGSRELLLIKKEIARRRAARKENR